MAEDFRARYQVSDGYAGGARPQFFTIRSGDVPVCPITTDKELREAFFEMVTEDMQQKISAINENADEFVKWARSQIASE